MHAALVRALVVTICAFFAIPLLAASAAAHSVPAAPPQAAAAATVVSTAVAVAVTTVKVRPGDSLSVIARRAWHHAAWWPRLWYANRQRIRNPDVITVGQVLRLPYGKAPRASTVRGALRAIPEPPPSPPAPASAPVRHRHHRYHAAAAPAVSYSGGIISYSGLESLWVRAGGPAWAEAAAATIAECESGGNPDAYNPSGATGLWQILGQVVGGDLRNPFVNALNAVSKFRASGDTFAQWVCQA